MDIVKTVKELTALTPEIDCDQKTMGLQTVSAVFLIAKSFWQIWASRRGFERNAETTFVKKKNASPMLD
jgi:hypothetical protein